MKTKLSHFTCGTFILLAVGGIAQGIYKYIHRPLTYPPNDPANNAIMFHVVLAIAAILAVIVIQTWRTKKKLSNIWVALFTQRALSRFTQTMMPRRITLLAIIRLLLCLLPLYLILWTPYRAAMQIVIAFDPSVTANAWGGPTYLGASLAHWLDGAVLMYLGALALHLIMVKNKSDQLV